MKLASYQHEGRDSYGVVYDGRLVDIPTTWADGPATLLEALQNAENALHRIANIAMSAEHTIQLDDVQLLAPIPNPPKLLGLAVNYVEHHREFDRGHDLPDNPKYHTTPRPFLMPNTAVAHPNAEIPWPSYSRDVDYEVELAVIIGKPTRCVSPEQARDCIAGYTIANDISARTVTHSEQRTERPKDKFFDWLHGKWSDGFCPMGPWMVTADEFGDPAASHLKCWVNDDLRQDADSDLMIFDVYELVSFCSEIMTLTPGDVIATGTPSGVGFPTGRTLSGGDRVTCEIEGIGTLVNTMGTPPESFYRPCVPS
ncbi:MAG: fumarylacetoacetate hydrolase family protein [Phycisphaerae bacterium]